MYQSKNILNTLSGHVVNKHEMGLWAKFWDFWRCVDDGDDEFFVKSQPLSGDVCDVSLFLAGEYEHVARLWCIVWGHVYDGEPVLFVYGGENGWFVD